ncbi:MAG TPA: c-type cytochrome [Planctomycetota bacterium]|nr:c-type cytochrome [Planctomycetota bacterium]
MKQTFCLLVLVFACASLKAGDAIADAVKTLLDDTLDMIERDTAVKTLAQTKDGALALIKLAEKQELPDELRSSAAMACAGCPDESVRTLAATKLPTPKSKDGKPLPSIQKLAEMTGDAAAGKAVFFNAQGANCQSCHQIGGQGNQVGPPLDAIGEKGKDILLESIIMPSAAVQHGFENYLVKLKAGGVKTGLLVDDGEEKIGLKDAQGEYIEIETKDIAKKVKQKMSLMPEGLVNTMTLQDLVNLVEYLSKQKVQQ